VSRNRALLLYCALVGAAGWLWLALSLPYVRSGPGPLLFFVLLALLIECFGFRTPPSDPHSLAGIVIVTAAFAFSPADSALVGASEALIFGVLLPFLYNRPRSLFLLVARPFLRSGLRAFTILLGASLADALAGGQPSRTLLLVCIMASFAVVLQLGRAGREYVQGGLSGFQVWWRSTWRSSLTVEVAPLPLAALGAAIYTRLGVGYFSLAALSLVVASISVRRAALNLQMQRRSVRELALLNEVSRAIIRSELDVDALVDLIYREASKIVDTSSFHLGLFDGDTYTLVVRVQDRVRLPRLTTTLENRDGIVGWIRETGRALLVEDFLEEMDRLPARPRYQSEHPPRSGIYVPLIAGERVIGSISIQSYRPRAFGTDDMRLLLLIADQAAVAIARARAFAEARTRSNQLQAVHAVSERVTAILSLDELLPSVVRLIREYFGYHPVHIFTAEGDPSDPLFVFRASTAGPEELTPLHALRLRAGEGIVGAAAQQASPVVVNDVRDDARYINADPRTRSELAVPLRVGDHVIGVLDVQSDQLDDFTADDTFVMRTLGDQIAIAIDSANSYTAQQEEAWTLNTLLQIAENVNSAPSLDELLPTIVRLPPLLMGCQRCYCLLWDGQRDTFTPVSAYGLTRAQRAAFLGVPLPAVDSPLLAALRDERRLLVVHDARAHSEKCPPIIGSFGGGTLLALPLAVRSTLFGALLLDFEASNARFTDRQLSLFTGVASQVTSALEGALLSLEAAEASRLEQELQVAQEIQLALMPERAPFVPGWDIAGSGRPARQVGGDFYDFWTLSQRDEERMMKEEVPVGAAAVAQVDARPTEPGPAYPSAALPSSYNLPPSSFRLGFVIADVSDKGVSAAMFMTMSRSLVRAAALDGSAPALALERANRWITRDSESGMFVTLFYGVLSPEEGTLRYSCAGHNPPLLYRPADDSFTTLHTPGIAMGVIEEVTLSQSQTTLEPGDVLVCYTDGVTEAINAEEEQFGVDRLRDVIRQEHSQGAQRILNAIYEAVDRFTSGQPPFDDITLVVLRHNEEDEAA
jgi:serine phosphatase RsbU (regulator of sigma subunit)/putative methionine-R-sulfoxide reductase with GAF domain